MKNFRYSLLAVCLLLLASCDRNEWNLPRTKSANAEKAPAGISDKDRIQIEAKDGATK